MRELEPGGLAAGAIDVGLPEQYLVVGRGK